MGLKESGLRGSLRNTSSVVPAFFDVTITNTNSPVQEGDILTVDYSADNTGDAQAMQDIRLEIDSVQEDVDTNVIISGGASTTGTLEWDTTGELEAEYTATVLSDDDSDTVMVNIADAIPDSVVHQYVYSDANTSSWPDRVGIADLSGSVTDVTSAVVTDGVDDIMSATFSSISPPFSISAVFEITNTTKDFQNPWNLYPAGSNGIDGNGYLFRNDQPRNNFNVFGDSSTINYEQPANTIVVMQAIFRTDASGELFVDDVSIVNRTPSVSSYAADEFGIGALLNNDRFAEANHFEYVIYDDDIESAGVRQDEYVRLSAEYQ